MTPLTKQPAYVEALQQINLLNAAVSKLQVRLTEIDIQIHENASALDREAKDVAAALSFAESGVVSLPVAIVEERAMLQRQLEAAQKVVQSRSIAMHQLAQELSRAACREAAPKHADICRRYLKALRALDALHEEEVTFFRSLEVQGYDAHHFPTRVQWDRIGLVREQDSETWRREREFASFAAP